jgi:phosphatidyl-myo-inositol dimannoside synthase
VRVLMLDNELRPVGGGTGVVNHYLLEGLADQRDVWVDVVTSARSRKGYETEHFAERITIYRVPVGGGNPHHFSNGELLCYSWRGFVQSLKLLKARDYDMSLAFSGVPAGVISYALERIAGLPYVVSLQGPDVPGFEARYNSLYPFLKPVLRRVWRRAAVVTAISKKHQLLALRTMPSLSIPIVYNGVDAATFYPRTTRTTAEINILCVGRLIERKSQHHLLRAFARLRASSRRPVRLTLAGTGDEEDSLRRLAAELSLNGDAAFLGLVPHDSMPDVYRGADIFVLPSHSEGMSIALLEALASGLPVVVTNTGGTAELVQESTNGIIVPWADVSALAEALKRLVEDEDTRLRMGLESRRIAKRFGWESLVDNYLGLCRQVAAGQVTAEESSDEAVAVLDTEPPAAG